MMIFVQPFDDDSMFYDFDKHRYILTEEHVRQMGIDLSLVLNTDFSPMPASVPALFLDRVSKLVYSNIYRYGRSKKEKEYLLACNPELREVIRDAMLERVAYVVDSGDMSTKTGALIQQGTRIDVKDLVASVEEEAILRSVGLLHRGDYQFVKDETLVY